MLVLHWSCASWSCASSPLVLRWPYMTAALGLYWVLSWIPLVMASTRMVLFKHLTGTRLVPYWYTAGTLLVLRWYDAGTALVR